MSFDRTPEWKLAAAIGAVSRQLARSVPAARGAPYFGLDVAEAFNLRAFDALSTRGIFRKYEFALDLGTGFGGRARWLATSFGCRILGLDSRPAVVAAATLLNRRAQLEDQVAFQIGEPQCLPLRERIFTHVWMLEAPLAACTAPHLAEAFRVLRRGGHFVLQCPIPSLVERAELIERLGVVGFFELESQEIAVVDVPQSWHLAQARLRAALEPSPEVLSAWVHSAPARPLGRRLNIFGRRPA